MVSGLAYIITFSPLFDKYMTFSEICHTLTAMLHNHWLTIVRSCYKFYVNLHFTTGFSTLSQNPNRAKMKLPNLMILMILFDCECADKMARELDASTKQKTWLSNRWGLKSIDIFGKKWFLVSQQTGNYCWLKGKKVSSPWYWLILIASWRIFQLAAVVITDTCCDS